MKEQKDHPPPPASVQEINTQLAIVQDFASADIVKVHLVLVIAYEHERRFSKKGLAVELDPDFEKRGQPEYLQRRPERGVPLTSTKPSLLLIAPEYDLRVQ